MTDQFQFDNPIIPGSIWDKKSDFTVPIVSPVGAGPKGEKGDAAYFDDLTEEQLQKIYQEASFVGNKSFDEVVTTTSASTTTIPIPWVDYDQFDMLFIDVNGLDLSEHDDYEIVSGNIVLTTSLPAGQDVHFRLLRYDVVDGSKSIMNIMGRKDYNTVAEMQADLALEPGDICHTLGFHTPGDGGGAWYKIKAHGVADGMDFIDLENGLIAELVHENIFIDFYNSSDYLYIAGTSGSDDGDGSANKPFKTIEGAFAWYAKHNKSDIRLMIKEAGTYDLTFCDRLVNCQIHLEHDVSNGDVIVNIGNKTCYNAYIHFTGQNTNHMKVNITTYHQDVGALYFYRCDLKITHMFNSWCGITFGQCTVEWLSYSGNNAQTNCQVNISDCVWINQNTSGAYFRCTGGQITFLNSLTFDGVASRTGAMFYLQNCIWNCCISSISALNSYTCGAEMIHSEWTMGIGTASAKTAAEAIFTNFVAGRGWYSTANALVDVGSL